MQRPNGGSIVIGKHGWRHVSFHVFPSEDKLAAKVNVSNGHWSGMCDTAFLRGELHQFAQDIEKLHADTKGQAVLAQRLTPNIDMTVTGDGKGHYTAAGSVRDDFAHSNYIAFDFALDPNELPIIVEALRAAERL
ncbi:MAG TPA: hypothetical protein VMT15_01210 [Bryobacteraceae bacterium]|nr:hypothetical protein [Bryobacteraceae bacterium]